MENNDNRKPPAPDGLPVAERRAKGWRFPWQLLVLAAVLSWGAWTAYKELVPGPEFTFVCTDSHRLRAGSEVLLNNRRIGEVTRMRTAAGPGEIQVVCRLECTEALADRVLRGSTTARIKRLEVQNLRIRAEDSLVRPPAVWLELGDPQASFADEFGFHSEAPIADARLRWNTLRTRVSWRSVHGLKYADRVFDHSGVAIGYVVGVNPDPAGDSVSVELAYVGYTDAGSCPYAREGTEHFIERFETKRLEVQGEDTPFFGRKIVVLRGSPEAKVTQTFVGRAEPPPHPGIRWNSPRAEVVWQDAHGLDYGSAVLADGVQVGAVDTVRVERPGRVHVGIVFFETDAAQCPYVHSGAEFWVKRFASERFEIQGGQQALLGPVVLVTPGKLDQPQQTEFAGRNEIPPDPMVHRDSLRVVVTWDSLWDLQPGAPVLSQGRRIGVVDRIQRDGRGWKVVIAIHARQSSDPPAEAKEEAAYFIGRFRTDRLQIQWADAALRGPAVVVVPGNPEGEPRSEFVGRTQPPPDPRVRWDSVRVSVLWSDVHGLRASAPVRASGSQVGEVEQLEYVAGSSLVRADIVFFTTDWDTCPYVREGTRYFANMARIGNRGIEGEASTALYGAHVDVIPDPLGNEASVLAEFRGVDSPPPLYRPRVGEQEVRLLSERSIPTDTPLHYFGELAGYVCSAKHMSDSTSWELGVRIYPRFQSLIRYSRDGTPSTVFFLEKGLEANFGWLGGSFQVDPSAVLRQATMRQAIEFRTKKDAGRPVVYAKSNPPRFPLHLEPEEEWLTWKTSVPVEPSDDAARAANRVPKPWPLRVKYTWRHRLRPLISWHENRGLALHVANGLLGPSELLKPTVDEASTTKAEFKIEGKEHARGNPRYRSITPGLVFMEHDISTSTYRWPLGRIGYASAPVDLWIVVAPGDVRAISRRRLAANGRSWRVDEDVGCISQWHGAPAIDRRTGKVIGMLLCSKGPDEAVVAAFPSDISRRLGDAAPSGDVAWFQPRSSASWRIADAHPIDAL
jgi:paraquat-inducible protein B